MIESCMFTCPTITREEGLISCNNMRKALNLLKIKGEGTDAEAYIKPLEALLGCHEATLWSAVDFHGLNQLDDHHISCCRTEVLLGSVLGEIELPEEKDTKLLHELLSGAAESARNGGRQCRVNGPGEHLGLPRGNEWEDAVNGRDPDDEETSHRLSEHAN